jgi:hypothetical protein
MTHSFGFILERLECREYSAPVRPGPGIREQLPLPDAEEQYRMAKDRLKTACAGGGSAGEAIEEFLTARSALRLLLEEIWPGEE